MFRKILAVSLALLPIAASAQTADDYFHQGAQFYIQGDKPKATAQIETGLRQFPNDRKLQQIAALLAKEEQPQKQQSGKKGQQPQKKDQSQQGKDQNQKGDSPQNQDNSGQDQAKNQDQQKSGDQKKPGDQSKDQKEQAQAGKKKEEPKPGQPDQSEQASAGKEKEDKEKAEEEAKQEAAMMAAGQMTPRQAQQLLDSEKDEDRVFQPAQANRPPGQSPSYKNW